MCLFILILLLECSFLVSMKEMEFYINSFDFMMIIDLKDKLNFYMYYVKWEGCLKLKSVFLVVWLFFAFLLSKLEEIIVIMLSVAFRILFFFSICGKNKLEILLYKFFKDENERMSGLVLCYLVVMYIVNMMLKYLMFSIMFLVK